MPHFASNTFEGRFPVARLSFDSAEFPGAVTLTALNPFIPLNDRDSSIPVAMFEIGFTNPTDAEITYSAVGVVGHGLHPPTKAGRVNRKGVAGVKVSTDEPDTSSPDYAEITLATDSPVTSRQTHLYRGHWFDALEVYWKDLHRPGPVRRARLWQFRHGRRHGPQPRFEPRCRAYHGGAGRDPIGALRAQLVHAELPQILDHAGLAFPPALGRGRAMEELVRDGMDRLGNHCGRSAGALGRAARRNPSASATRSIPPRCRCR